MNQEESNKENVIDSCITKYVDSIFSVDIMLENIKNELANSCVQIEDSELIALICSKLDAKRSDIITSKLDILKHETDKERARLLEERDSNIAKETEVKKQFLTKSIFGKCLESKLPINIHNCPTIEVADITRFSVYEIDKLIIQLLINNSKHIKDQETVDFKKFTHSFSSSRNTPAGEEHLKRATFYGAENGIMLVDVQSLRIAMLVTHFENKFNIMLYIAWEDGVCFVEPKADNQEALAI